MFLIKRHFSILPNFRLLPSDSATIVSGRIVKKQNEDCFDVRTPISDDLLKKVPIISHDEIVSAIKECKKSQHSWSNESAVTRSKVIRKMSEILEKNQDEMSQIIHLENGKSLSDALGEVSSAIAGLEWYSEEAKRTNGLNITPVKLVDNFMLTCHEPVGVVSIITPWNFPLSMITRKAGAALAAGCGTLIKPSFHTPLSSIAFAKICLEADLPPGLISIITCSSKEDEMVGNLFTQSPLVDMFGFTGSSRVGKKLYSNCSTNCKHVNLELGGNAPFIVFESADLHAALKGLLASKFRCSGQTCISPNRLFLHAGIKDEFVRLLTDAMKGFSIAPGDKGSLAPLISKDAVKRVDELVTSSVQMGAECIIGGDLSSESHHRGYYYPATLLDKCHERMPIVAEEIFGPVLPIIEFNNESQVVELANGTEAGLAGYFYSNDVKQIFSVAKQLQFGMLGVNTGMISTTEAPFGGVKHSGLGREGGPDCLKEFMNTKYVSICKNYST